MINKRGNNADNNMNFYLFTKSGMREIYDKG